MSDLLLQEQKEDSRRYRWTLWWVEHQAQLKKIGIGIFITADALLFAIVFWALLDSFVVSHRKEERAVAELVVNNQEELHAYTTARAATPLSTSDARVFAIGNNRYDAYAEIENANTDWWAEFSYTFIYAGGSTQARASFVLPGETKPITELAIETTQSLADARLELQKITWHRLDHRVIKDYDTWSKDRLTINIKDPTFVQESSADGQNSARVTFSVENHTAFSYYQPVFVILLKRGSSVVGVNKTTLQTLESGATQSVSVSWFGSIPSVSQVEVRPEINLFDPSAYKALMGESGVDTRARVIP